MSHNPTDQCTNCGGFGHTRSECPWPRPGEEAARAHLAAPDVACMGGWCHVRDCCGRYHDTTAGAVSERLCIRGEEFPERMQVAA